MRSSLVRMTSSEEWRSRVESWKASGKSAREFCIARGFSAKSLQWWAWHFGRKTGRKVVEEKPVRFARVVTGAPRIQADHERGLVVHVGAARVEVGAGADRETVTAVLQALMGNSTGARS